MSETIVIAETRDGELHPVTAELVYVANTLGDSITVVVPGTNDAAATSAASISGVGKVIASVGECFAAYDAASWAESIDSCAPSGIIICAATQNGKDLASRLAARRSISVVQDVVALSLIHI